MDLQKHPARGPPSVLLVAIVFLAFCESALVSHPEPVPLPILADKLETDSSSSYAFDYSVSDAKTGDAKSQWETQLDGVVRGQYALLGPDGNLRSVSYTADDANGFQAVVRYMDPRQTLSEEGLDEGPGPATHSSEWENQRLEQQPLPSGLGVLRPGNEQYIGLAHDGASSMYRYQHPFYDSGYRLHSTFLWPKPSSHGSLGHQLQNQQVGDIQPPPWTSGTGGIPGQTPWRTWTWSNQPKHLPPKQPIIPKPPIPVDTSYVYFGKSNDLRATTISPTRPETQCQKEWRPVTGQYTTPNLKYHTKGDKIHGKGGGGDRTSPGGGTRETSPSAGSTAPGDRGNLRIPGNLLYSEAPAALYIPFPGKPQVVGGTTTTATPTGTKAPTVFTDTAENPRGFLRPPQFVPTASTPVRSSGTTPTYSDPPSFNYPNTPNYADALLNAISELARAPTRESIRQEQENPPLSDLELQRVPAELIKAPTREPIREEQVSPPFSYLELKRVPVEQRREPLREEQESPQLSDLELERVPVELKREPVREDQESPQLSDIERIPVEVTQAPAGNPIREEQIFPLSDLELERVPVELIRAPTRESIPAHESPYKSDLELERVPIELLRIPTGGSVREHGHVESTLFRPPESVPQSELELERVPIDISRIPTLEPQLVPTTPPQKSETHKRKTSSKNSNVNSNVGDDSITPGVSTEKPPRKSNSKKRASANTKRGKPSTTVKPPTKKRPSTNKSSKPVENSSKKTKIASNRNGGPSFKSKAKKTTSTTQNPETPLVQMNAETINSLIHINKPTPVDTVTTTPFTQEPQTSIPITNLETTKQSVNMTDSSESSLETQGSFQKEYIHKTIFDYFDTPPFNMSDFQAAVTTQTSPQSTEASQHSNVSSTTETSPRSKEISPRGKETTPRETLPRTEISMKRTDWTIPYSTTTQPSDVPVETSPLNEVTANSFITPLKEVTTNSFIKDEFATEVPSATTSFLRNHVESYGLDPDTSGTTQQYTMERHNPFYHSVLVESSEAVTHPPRSSSTTVKDFLNVTDSNFDSVTTTTSAPLTSRIHPLKMLSSPTEMSMDFSSFNDDGIFEQDVLDPAVALSERVSVSLETTTTETVPSADAENEVKEVTPPTKNGAQHYTILISLVTCLAMFLPIFYNFTGRRV